MCGVGRGLETSLSETSSELGQVNGVVGMLVDKQESCPHKHNYSIEPKMALCKGHDILEPKIGDLNLGRFRRISVKIQHFTSNLNLIIKYQSYILYYVVVARYA